MRWHNKPPVNGRKLTAEDVKYTYERAMTLAGNPSRAVVDEIQRVEALDRYTVRFVTKEPFAWFLDSAAHLYILAKEVGEKYGDFKKAESMIGTGPWMLERVRAERQGRVRPQSELLLRARSPLRRRRRVTIDPDPASRFAGWLSGRYDFGPELGTVVRRIDLDAARRRKPNLQTVEFVWLVSTIGIMKLDEDPFKDIRVRRALAMAGNPQEMAKAIVFCHGPGPRRTRPCPRRSALLVHPDRPAHAGGTPDVRAHTRARRSGCWRRPAIRAGSRSRSSRRRAGDPTWSTSRRS